jgi:hypothetical protein
MHLKGIREVANPGENKMKKIILMLLLIMILLFTELIFLNADEHAFVTWGIGGGDSPGREKDMKGILNAVSPSIVKVIAQSRKLYFASGIAIDRRHVISNAVVARDPYRRMYIKTVNNKTYTAKLVGKTEGKREKKGNHYQKLK